MSMDSFPEIKLPQEQQQEAASDARQQNKIIKTIESGNLEALNQPLAAVSAGERDSFFDKVLAGVITEETLDSDLVRNIGAPFSGLDGAQKLHEELQNNQRVQRDVGEAIRATLYDKNAVHRKDWQPTPEEVGRFVQMYPTPHAFDKALVGNRLQELQAAFEQEQSPGRRDALKMEITLQKQKEREMYPHLRTTLYGKRNEYWEQSKLLLKEARGDEVAEAAEVGVPVQEPVAIPPYSTEQPFVSPLQEKPMPPETTEFLRDHVIEQDLSYQDAVLPEEVKQRTLDWSKKSESAQKYANSIVELSQRANLETIRQAGKEITQIMSAEATRLGIPVSSYGKSNTWAMWDIGKQNYFFTHQAENNPTYEIGDPLTSETKREEIINRHLGWEAYAAFRGNVAQEWRQKIMSDRKFSNALELLNKSPKQNNSLSSRDLAELGKILREVK